MPVCCSFFPSVSTAKLSQGGRAKPWVEVLHHFAAPAFRPVTGWQVKAEHADSFAVQHLAHLKTVAKERKMIIKRLLDGHFAIGRADRGKRHAMSVEHSLDFSGFLQGKLGTAFAVHAAQLNAENMFTGKCRKLILQRAGRFVRKSGQYPCGHRQLLSI